MPDAHITGVGEEEFAAGEGELAGLGPAVVLRHAKLDTDIADAIAVDGVGELEGLAPGQRLGVDVDAELARQLEEGHHGVVELAVHEGEAQGHVARAVELEDVLLGRGAATAGTAAPSRRGAGAVVPARRRAGQFVADDARGAALGVGLVALEGVAELVGDGDEEEQGVAPGGVDLGPVDGLAGEAAEAEAVDGGEAAVVADVEGVVVDVGALELLEELRVVAVLDVDAVALRLEVRHLGGEDVALAPEPVLLGVEPPRLLLEGEYLLVQLLLLLLQRLEVAHGLGQRRLGLGRGVPLRLDVLLAGLVRLDVAEVLYVGVPLPGRDVQLLLEPLDEHVRAVDADRVVDVRPRGEDLEEAVYPLHVVFPVLAAAASVVVRPARARALAAQLLARRRDHVRGRRRR